MTGTLNAAVAVNTRNLTPGKARSHNVLVEKPNRALLKANTPCGWAHIMYCSFGSNGTLGGSILRGKYSNSHSKMGRFSNHGHGRPSATGSRSSVLQPAALASDIASRLRAHPYQETIPRPYLQTAKEAAASFGAKAETGDGAGPEPEPDQLLLGLMKVMATLLLEFPDTVKQAVGPDFAQGHILESVPWER